MIVHLQFLRLISAYLQIFGIGADCQLALFFFFFVFPFSFFWMLAAVFKKRLVALRGFAAKATSLQTLQVGRTLEALAKTESSASPNFGLGIRILTIT